MDMVDDFRNVNNIVHDRFICKGMEIIGGVVLFALGVWVGLKTWQAPLILILPLVVCSVAAIFLVSFLYGWPSGNNFLNHLLITIKLLFRCASEKGCGSFALFLLNRFLLILLGSSHVWPGHPHIFYLYILSISAFVKTGNWNSWEILSLQALPPLLFWLSMPKLLKAKFSIDRGTGGNL